jgi:hypothetical protein
MVTEPASVFKIKSQVNHFSYQPIIPNEFTLLDARVGSLYQANSITFSKQTEFKYNSEHGRAAAY